MKRIRSAMAALIALALLCGAFALPAAAIDTGAFAAEVLRLVNEERAKAGLAALEGGPASLEAAAGLRAREISVSFGHSRPDGSSCFTALAEHGVACAACGENIASGQATPAQVMAAWMGSPGHRANILGNYNRLGVGVYEKNGRLHWAQMFLLERGGTSGNAAATTTRASTAASTATTASTARAASTTAAATTASTARAAAISPPGNAAAARPDWLEWVLRVFFLGWLWMK
jgi:uncharacterized protein YkwD